jgi:hypothetical protein
VCLCLPTFSSTAAAQIWTSPLLGRELVIIEKTVSGEESSAGPLPEAVQEKLGEDFVEYETFVAARLSATEAKDLVAAALVEGRNVLEDPHAPIVLPFHTFSAEGSEKRSVLWAGRQLQPKEVPGLFLIRFAFPLRQEWSDALRSCGAEPILYYGNGVFLARAGNFGMIKSCASVVPYLDWVDTFLTTDRISPDMLDAAGLDLAPYSLTFAPGTDLETALAELPAVVEVGDSMVWEDGTLSVGVAAGAPELEALIRTSLRLLSIQEASGEPEPADERQGQIVAGNYVGYPGAISGAVNAPGYLTWLANRGLRSAAN